MVCVARCSKGVVVVARARSMFRLSVGRRLSRLGAAAALVGACCEAGAVAVSRAALLSVGAVLFEVGGADEWL